MRRAPVLTTAGTLVLALATSVIAAAPAAADDPLSAFHDQEVVWAPCEEDLLAELECAGIEVPLDYADPGGERATIAVSRRSATDPERRRGILLTNPGGPGGTGRHLPIEPRPDLNVHFTLGDQRVTEVYDVIGMDPRGSGASTPRLDCGRGMPLPPPRPDDDEFSTITRTAIATQRACESAHGDLIPHMTTANTARDMDVIRAALGEEQTSYYGVSYGTYLGAVYGSLFPERLDRSVLDSSVTPDGMWRGVFTRQSEGYHANMERYTAWAAGHDDVLGFGSTPEDVLASIEGVRDRLEDEPRYDIPGMPEGVPFTGDDFDFYVGMVVRPQHLWDLISMELGHFVHDVPFPEYEFPEPGDPGIELGNDSLLMAVSCEAEWPSRLSGYHSDMREIREWNPYGIGAIWHAPQPCTFASEGPTEPLVELERDGYPTGLIIAAEYDANTVYEGGPLMADRLDNALITVTDEGGHGFYPIPGMDCVTDAVDAYLVDGADPGDLTCQGLPRAEAPLPVGAENAVGEGIAEVMGLREDPLRAMSPVWRPAIG
ncbi:alpha/beta fold hydrolase [Nocardiopsis lambiniae]|uniref:Alpha/beta fold hydrolase n=1 Tax=Nocardiopsis lambiniae TaxID=3075539 RepID=A0ABU2MET2_9ACTN|nr:alpha/beta fold hydrolase [Nocardiopsis sp. DSM 44743]MDT0331045.1 alpha/beta fold hydrolase [Nocardiopsis sp. DSM 44743]